MKILHIIPRMVPSYKSIFVGGAVNPLINLIEYTSKYFKSSIYTHTDLGLKKSFNEVKINGAEIWIEENRMRPCTLLYGLYFLMRGIRTIIKQKAWEADIIHSHSGSALYGLLTVLLGKILRKPTIHSLYCPINSSKKNQFYAFIYSKLSYLSLICADKILAISKNIKVSLQKIGIPQKKIILLPPIVNTNKFHPQYYSNKIRNELGTCGKGSIILFVGNLNDSKGLDTLVDALGSLVKKKYFQFILTLELKGKKFETQLERINKKIKAYCLSEYITQLGIIDYMPALMASVDFLVVPYRDTDGPSDYPIALLEAMASGIPAIGTRVGGIPELIENGITGILVEPDNVHELALATKKMLDDSTYRIKLGKNAWKKSMEMFKNENIGNKIKKIYKDLLKN